MPVISYGTDEFPAFFSPSSGVQSPLRLDRPSDVAAAAKVSVGWRVYTGSARQCTSRHRWACSYWQKRRPLGVNLKRAGIIYLLSLLHVSSADTSFMPTTPLLFVVSALVGLPHVLLVYIEVLGRI